MDVSRLFMFSASFAKPDDKPGIVFNVGPVSLFVSFFADTKSVSQTIFHRPICCNSCIDAAGAVGFVSTSTNCLSLFTLRVLIPVARIGCLVSVTSMVVLFSDNTRPKDSFSLGHRGGFYNQ